MKERAKRRTVQVHKSVLEGEEVIGRVSFTFDETRLLLGISWQNETCERRDEDLAGRASFRSSRRLLDSRRRDNMMNRLRTVLVSVTAVAVTMMVLGSNARAQSVSTASPQNYLRFLQGLPETKNGISLPIVVAKEGYYGYYGDHEDYGYYGDHGPHGHHGHPGHHGHDKPPATPAR